MRTHGGQTNTPVQTREMTTRRCEEDRRGGDGCGWRGKLTLTCNFRSSFLSNLDIYKHHEYWFQAQVQAPLMCPLN